MSAQAGYKTIIQINNTSLTTMTGITSIELQISSEIYTITDLNNNNWQKKITGVNDYTVKLAGNFDLTDAQQTLLQADLITNPGTTASFKILPQGVGNPGYAGTVIIKDMDLKFDIKSEQQVTFDFEGTGPIVYS